MVSADDDRYFLDAERIGNDLPDPVFYAQRFGDFLGVVGFAHAVDDNRFGVVEAFGVFEGHHVEPEAAEVAANPARDPIGSAPVENLHVDFFEGAGLRWRWRPVVRVPTSRYEADE